MKFVNSWHYCINLESVSLLWYSNENYVSLVINSYSNSNWYIPIKKVGNRMIYIDEIASIREQEQESRSYYRINGIDFAIISISITIPNLPNFL